MILNKMFTLISERTGTGSFAYLPLVLFIILESWSYKVETVTFLPFGPANHDSALPRKNDAFKYLKISTEFSFFGDIFTEVQISTNGILSFEGGNTNIPISHFPLNGTRSVAAYWVDTDPRKGGNIFYRETHDKAILDQINSKIQNSFVQFGNFRSTWALITTFNNVPRSQCGECSKVVNFQAILTTDGIHSFVVFLYDRLDYGYAQIGFNAGDGKRFYVTSRSRPKDSGQYVLSHSNVNIPGEWIFSIGEKIYSTCEDNGLLMVYPRRVLYIELQEITITGPCLKNNESTIYVKFGSMPRACKVIGASGIRCLTPFFNELGKVPIELTHNNIIFRSFVMVHDSVDVLFANTASEDSDLEGLLPLKNSIPVNVRGSLEVFYLSKQGDIMRTNYHNINLRKEIRTNGTLSLLALNEDIKESMGVIVNVIVQNGTGYSIQMITEIKRPQSCRDWYKREYSSSQVQAFVKRASKVNPCPPRVPNHLPYRLPGDFVIDEERNPWIKGYFNHPGASICYRSRKNPNRISTQCCYNSLNSLILRPPGGGRINLFDTYISRYQHIVKDIYPYLLCCKWSDNCDKYYEKRPSIPSTHYKAPSPPVTVAGDSHFKTMDGFTYTFNPIGEFIYLEAPNTQVQCRISQYKDFNASYFSAFVVKTESEENIQIELDSHKNLIVTIALSALEPGTYTFNDVTVDFINSSVASVSTDSGVAITIYSLGGVLNSIMTLEQSLKGKVHGLVGNWDDIKDNDLMLPNRTAISISSTSKDIHYLFGLSWATTEETSVFTYAEGTDWKDYQNAKFVPFFGTPPPDPRCKGNAQCLFDLYVTNDTGLALSNLIIQRASEDMHLEALNSSDSTFKPFTMLCLMINSFAISFIEFD